VLLETLPNGSILAHNHGPDSRCSQTLCGKEDKGMLPNIPGAGGEKAADCPECNRLWNELKEKTEARLNQVIHTNLDNAEKLRRQADEWQRAAVDLIEAAQNEDWDEIMATIGADAADVFCMASPMGLCKGWDLRKIRGF
jgi:hypothetical protein